MKSGAGQVGRATFLVFFSGFLRAAHLEFVYFAACAIAQRLLTRYIPGHGARVVADRERCTSSSIFLPLASLTFGWGGEGEKNADHQSLTVLHFSLPTNSVVRALFSISCFPPCGGIRP